MNQESKKVDRLVPKPMTRDRDNALGQRVPPFRYFLRS